MDLKSITAADVYDRDNRLRGLIDLFEIGGRNFTEVEHKTLGMVGVLKLPARPLQAIEGKLKISHLDDVYDRDLTNPAMMHDWQMHQKVSVNDRGGYSIEKSHTIVWHAGFQVMGDDGMGTETGEKSEIEYKLTVPRLKIYRLGDENAIWELDVFNDVFEINGQPVWA